MTIGTRVRRAGKANVYGTIVPTPAYGAGTWVRWDDGETIEVDPASLEEKAPVERRQ